LIPQRRMTNIRLPVPLASNIVVLPLSCGMVSGFFAMGDTGD